jgi:hypothetical protein
LIGKFLSLVGAEKDWGWFTNVSISVNMYASTWICTKEAGVGHEDVKAGSPRLRKTSLAELKLEAPALRME